LVEVAEEDSRSDRLVEAGCAVVVEVEEVEDLFELAFT
jgi:hypothetical protein